MQKVGHLAPIFSLRVRVVPNLAAQPPVAADRTMSTSNHR